MGPRERDDAKWARALVAWEMRERGEPISRADERLLAYTFDAGGCNACNAGRIYRVDHLNRG